MRIVVKVGTNVLAHTDHRLNITNISHLADQIAALKAEGHEIILISSGAVGAGMSMYRLPENMNKVVRRQVLSSIGQVRLMEIYRQLFANHKLYCAQVLATKEDFNVAMKNAVLPARVKAIQPEIAAGQLAPTGRLLEPSEFSKRGEVAVLLEMVYPEHQALLVNGSGCIVQAYDRNLGHGLFAHILGGLGIIKAWGLRIKVWIALVTGVGRRRLRLAAEDGRDRRHVLPAGADLLGA